MMLFVVIFSILWNFCSCGIISTVKPQQDVSWKNPWTAESIRISRPTLKPIDGDSKTLEPTGQNKNATKTSIRDRFAAKDFDAVTMKPTDSRKFTISRPTLKPIDGDRKTLEPTGQNKNATKTSIRDRFATKDFDAVTMHPTDWRKFAIKRHKSDRFSTKTFIAVTLKSTAWRSFTIKPYKSDRFTIKPFEWDRFTIKNYDWERFTVKPFEWDLKPFTFKPYEPETNTRNISYRYGFFPPIFITALIVLICKYTVCKKRSTGTLITVMPPPVIPNSNEGNQTFQATDTRINLATDNFTPLASNTHFLGATSGSANGYKITDKPPEYSELVSVDCATLPSVVPPFPESPPPKYDEGNPYKY